MTTTLQYLDDTYLFESTGSIGSTGRDDKGYFAILDQTNFYPQGGGQRADKGTLLDHDQNEIPVIFVGFRDGEVLHYVPEALVSKLSPGHSVILRVDMKSRLINARLHSAGHLVSHALETIEPSLVPIKGYHFGDGPYVEFVNRQGLDVSQLIEKANGALAAAIAAKHPIIAAYTKAPIIQETRPALAPFIPKDKPSRTISIGDYTPLPCGGTHVANLAELGTVRITKVKAAKHNVRARYDITAL
jgi:alanyl-tRNA synthetase